MTTTTTDRPAIPRPVLPVLRAWRAGVGRLWAELRESGWTHAVYGVGTSVDEHVWEAPHSGTDRSPLRVSVLLDPSGARRVAEAEVSGPIARATLTAPTLTVSDVLDLAAIVGVLTRCARCDVWTPAACSVCAACEKSSCGWCGDPVPAGATHCSAEHAQYDAGSETTWRRTAGGAA